MITPQFSDVVDTRYFIEALNAPQNPISLLDRFPDALYTKSPDSHFIRFMYTLLGPVGVAWLKVVLLQARLELEAAGFETFDLERFYGDPFSFGRILTETFDDDIGGLLPAAVWDRIKAQDEAYRSRAIEFMNAARLGTSPQGMQLAASSGTGQNCEVVENYKYLFDIHSDDPLGLPFYGSSLLTGEFIVLPRPEVSRTQQQLIDFSGAVIPLDTNHFTISFAGASTPLLAPTVSAIDVQRALTALRSIGIGNVIVSGGPAPNPLVITFTGQLTNQVLPTLNVSFNDGTVGLVTIPVIVSTGVVDPSEETAVIADADRHHMQVALDYLRPVASYPTFHPAPSTLRTQLWSAVSSSTAFTRVIRFVTGNPAVAWPAVDEIHWIAPSIELEAPQLQNGRYQHYVNFHNVAAIQGYTDDALSDSNYLLTGVAPQYNSVHVGPFPEMASVMPYFSQFADLSLVFSADRALPDYTEPLLVSTQTGDGTAFIDDIYPADYATLQGVPALKYHNEHFWSSRARTSGAEVLEIDLGSPQAVNFIALELTRKPVSIAISYDLLDLAPQRRFTAITSLPGFPFDNELYFDSSIQSPWEYLEYHFNDGLGMIYTRFIRLLFTRRIDNGPFDRFLFDPATQIQTPWSIDVRNLRIGRNVPPSAM